MKRLLEYLNEAKKALDNNLFKEIAQALVDKADEGPYSFWEETDGFTGKYRRYRNDPIKFENILVKDLTKILSSYDNLSELDYEDFTDDIQSIFVGDGNGETDYGDNAHDEILEIVEKVFKKFKVGKDKQSISNEQENNLLKKYKKSKNVLYIFAHERKGHKYFTLEVKKYDKITKDYVIFKKWAEDEKFHKNDKYKYLTLYDNIFILPIDDAIDFIENIKKVKNKKIKLYEFLYNPTWNPNYDESDPWKDYIKSNIEYIKRKKTIEYEVAIQEYPELKFISNEDLDRLIEELKK